MNIEKAFTNYLKGTGPKPKENEIMNCTEMGNCDVVISVLFKLVNEEINTMDDTKTLDRCVEVLKTIGTILNNQCEFNRKKIARKIYKLDEKLDRVLEEGHKKFININKIKSEFNKVRRQLDILLEVNEEKDSKQYDFMHFLIEETKNITYLEYALKKMPALANVKDKDEVPLFRNLLSSYLDSVMLLKEEDILYYKNLITLLLSQKSFKLSDTEKRKCLEDIHKLINKLSYNKKSIKKNQQKLDHISNITNIIKGMEDSEKSITDIAAKYNIEIFFNPTHLEQLSLVKTPKEGNFANRRVVDEYVLSIDGKDAIEIDDALSCIKLPNGNYRLGVHIASVLSYFPYESEIVQEAIKRNQSIYLPYKYQKKENDFSRTIPIFPYEFSANKASLKEGEYRLARSYFFEIDSEGNIVKEDFAKTIIKNQKQLSYDEVNQIIEKGCSDKALEETIQNLKQVTSHLDKKTTVTELYDKLKEFSEDYSELRVSKVGSENIVYQSMLLTGNRVASFFAKNNYPCLYRIHEVNEETNKKLQAMINELNKTYSIQQFKNLYQVIEGIYPKGWYGVDGRHVGLGLDHYCHCTSVLRRAADIVVEHALEECYDKEPTEEKLKKLQDEIASKAIEINAKQSPIDFFVKEYQKKYHH